MSWILGIISDQISSDLIQIISKIHPPSIHHFQSNQIYLASGEISDMCLTGSFSINPKSVESGWMTVGLGIERKEASCRFLKASDWQTLLSKQKPDLSYIDGHFVAIRWQNGMVECFSDQFGLRTLYISRLANSIVFTTRLDWVALLTGKSEIDFEQFGSQWLTFNQLSYGCLVKGIQRLGPGGVAICKSTSIEIHNTPWLPNFSPEDSPPLEQTLTSLLNPEIENSHVLSLGLSGGLDSRLLLACLLAKSKKRFSLHLFGHSDEPDVRVAQQIANDYHLDQHFFPESIPKIGTNLIVLREYIAKTCLTTPASSWLKLRFYPELNRMNRIMIDGGMGEIARRQFLNRIYWKGRRKLLHDSPVEIFPYIQSHRASIFSSEIINVMRGGINQQLIAMRDEMPPIENIGVENFLDLLIVRYRFPNYAGMDQSRIDEEIVNYMPFAQPSFVQAAFRTPVQIKRGGKLFRKFIHKLQPALTIYPLVKGMTTYPYRFSTVPASLYTKAKAAIGIQFHNPTREEFLLSLKEYINDLIVSSEVKNFPAYNQNALQNMVKEYFSGNKNLAGELDWWISFELWRQSIGQFKS